MAEIKPLGSEKLNGDEKLKRILELTYYNEKSNKPTSNRPELVKESKNGCVYGIVKEKDGYYVKSGLNESSLDYIGGMFMKNKNKFSSYADAFKRLEFIKGQEELNEATKYVLKQNSPKTESPLADPAADAPIAPPVDAPAPAPSEPSDMSGDLPTEPEIGDEEPSAETEPESTSEPKRSDYMAEVQKYAGKLGQELRDLHDKMESDDIKYVLNMIISAVDLDKLEDDDIEDIGKKFERDEEGEGEGGDMEDLEMDPEVPAEEPTGDEELGEEDITMDALERFINTPMDTDEIDLSKYADLEEGDFEGMMDNGNKGTSRMDKIRELESQIFDKYQQLLDMGHDPRVAHGRIWGGKMKSGVNMVKKPYNTQDDVDGINMSPDSHVFDLDESGNYDASSRSYTFNPEGDIDEVSYVGQRNPKLMKKGEYTYDPLEMDTNLHKKYRQLMDMGHSDEESQRRTFYPGEDGFTNTHYNNIDMTPPKSRKYNEPTNWVPKKRPEIGSHGEEHMDEEVELDLEEIKKEINNSINNTLGKYFK
jgi:hypothetical protein